MIIVRLTGGLGNQMFQYAFGRYLSIKNKTILKLDASLLCSDETSQSQPSYALDIFNINPEFASKEEVIGFNGEPGKTLLKKLQNHARKYFFPYRFVVQRGHEFDPSHLDIEDDYSISGRWQSEKYFLGAEKEIREGFMFKNELDEYALAMSESIHANDSIAIHVRRGDYATNPHFSTALGTLSDEYYIKSINRVSRLFVSPRYYVFSDDIAYCKKLFAVLGKKITFVEQVDDAMSAEYDLRLMSQCKGYIISNSTYAWWGAWLSGASGSNILAPSKWAIDERYCPPEIFPEGWQTINSCS